MRAKTKRPMTKQELLKGIRNLMLQYEEGNWAILSGEIAFTNGEEASRWERYAWNGDVFQPTGRVKTCSIIDCMKQQR